MGETPIIRSAHNGHLATVKFLVEQGADVNSIDMVRPTPPALAPPCLPAFDLTCAACCAQGDNTALHWASMRGHVEIVKFLVARGADKGLRNKQDKVAIDLAQPCWSNSYRFTREVLAAY
jgi:ankyrin repeat protein